MKCPRCGQEAAENGTIRDDTGTTLRVFQCPRCEVPWRFDGQEFAVALTWAVGDDGEFFDPATGDQIKLN